MRIQGSMQYNKGMIANAIKKSVSDEKMQQRYQKKELTQEQRDIQELKKRISDLQKSNKIAGIHTKLGVGAKLTKQEVQYLKNKHPEVYREYKEAELEKETYKKQLENCKTKEDVERLKMTKMGQFMASANRIYSNANIPKEKKIKLLKRLLTKSNNVEVVHTEFIKSIEFAKLPEKEEDKNKIRNKETSNKKIKLGEIHSDIREKADLESENLETGNLKIEEMIYSLQGQVYA